MNPENQEHHETSPDSNNTSNEQQISAPSTENVVQATALVANPVTQTIAPQSTPKPTNSPGIIVLQWLTYAFWGWTILAVSILTATVLTTFISGEDSGYFAPYPMASALVLLPISFVCDYYYHKYEPEKKTGAASIVMVIHAVIYGLLGIGSVVAIVISILTLVVNSSDTDGSLIALSTALITTLLYTAVFLRVLNPSRLRWVRKTFLIIMVVVVGGVSILGIVGPLYKASVARNDRLIGQSLPEVNRKIQSYARNNEKLPDNLTALNLDGDEEKLVDSGLIEYTPNTKSPSSANSSSSSIYRIDNSVTYYYELCATFAAEKNSEYNYDSYYGKDEYSNSPSVYYHDKGRQCYKIQETVY